MGQKMADNRIVHFDNIRYLMVLLVVVLHSACGYSNNTQWWAVNVSLRYKAAILDKPKFVTLTDDMLTL